MNAYQKDCLGVLIACSLGVVGLVLGLRTNPRFGHEIFWDDIAQTTFFAFLILNIMGCVLAIYIRAMGVWDKKDDS